MRLYFAHLRTGDKPITTVDEYRAERHQCELLRKRWEALRETGGPEFHALGQQDTLLFQDFRRRLPYVLISKCPYCGTLVWRKAFVFSLQDEFDCASSLHEQAIRNHAESFRRQRRIG